MGRAGIAICIISSVIVFACQKKDTASRGEVSSTSLNNVTLSNTLSYGDSLFYTSVTGAEKIVFPVSKPSETGYFASSLPGLHLDSATGRINISRSESGLRYIVYYLSTQNQLIASATVTISGIDYQDRIYDISSNESGNQVAVPIYNMTPGLGLPCTNLSGQVCIFDETDFNNDGIEDIPGANRNKLAVDVNNGSINLKESFMAGVFGPFLFNGKRKDVTIYYRLDDGSNMALNKITIRLVYFRSRAFIPESMSLEINSRNERYQQITSASTAFGTLLYYTTTTKPKRPPLIVIVSGL